MSRLIKFSLFLWFVVFFLLALMLSGCTVFKAEVAPKIASGVKHYCAEPLEERLLIREQVNGLIAPASIKVTCEGDVP